MNIFRPKIGCALPFPLLTGEGTSPVLQNLSDCFGSVDSLLKMLSASADTVELRTVRATDAPQKVLLAAQCCASRQLGVTIHATMEAADTPERFFTPYQLLLESKLQPAYNLTIHALTEREQTEQLLTTLCRYAEQHAYPVFLTLENNRQKAERSCGDSAAAVGEIVCGLALPRLAACWDFGHFYSNLLNFGGEADALPPVRFLQVVRHTHIHGLLNNRTHFPLDKAAIPLEAYCGALRKVGYSGIFSLELDFPRFYPRIDAKEAVLGSLRCLRATLDTLS